MNIFQPANFRRFLLVLCGVAMLAMWVGGVSAEPTALNINIDRSDDAVGLACDSGVLNDCSLRSAIAKANAAFADDANIGNITIGFDQSRTIELTRQLPELTADHVFIRPTVLGSLTLTIDGNDTVSNGLVISGGDVEIKDTTMRGFTHSFIHTKANAHSVELDNVSLNGGCLTSPFRMSQTAGAGTEIGVQVDPPGRFPATDRIRLIDSEICGMDKAGIFQTGEAKLFVGVRDDTSSSVSIRNNNIGIWADKGCGVIVYVANIVSNDAEGILFDQIGNAANDYSCRNFVYTDVSITNNGGAGVAILGTNTSSARVRPGAVHSNGGLAIDIGNDGHTVNDVDDVDAGPNHILNYPEITVEDSTGFLMTSLCDGCFGVAIYEAVGDPTQPGGGGTFLRWQTSIQSNKVITINFYDVDDLDTLTFMASHVPFGSSEFSPIYTHNSTPTSVSLNTMQTDMSQSLFLILLFASALFGLTMRMISRDRTATSLQM